MGTRDLGVELEVEAWAPSISRRARSVWAVLALSTIMFLALCGLVTSAGSRYLSQLTVPQEATLDVREGAQVSIQPHRTSIWQLVTRQTRLNEGDRVQSAADKGAFIGLFDGSTIQTYDVTDLTFTRLRTSRFFRSEKDIAIHLANGIVVLTTAGSEGFSQATYALTTDQGEILVGSNSKVRIHAQPPDGLPPSVSSGTSFGTATTQVIVDYGSATLVSGGQRLALSPGTMARIIAGNPMEGPLEAAEQLVRNGTFVEPPNNAAEAVENGGIGAASWQPVRELPPDPASGSGSVEATAEGVPGAKVGRSVLMSRSGELTSYAKVGIRQDINLPVEFYGTVTLNAFVRVDEQTVPVGGPQGDLFPLTIRITYSDGNGIRHEWRRSFYYGSQQIDGSDEVDRVEQGTWVSLEQLAGTTPNPFVLKSAETGQDMVVLHSIEAYAFGADFQSWIAGVSIVGR